MCLDYVDEKMEPCEKGYKVMEYEDNELFGAYQNINKVRNIGIWLDEHVRIQAKE
jgi:hypothetical protein